MINWNLLQDRNSKAFKYLIGDSIVLLPSHLPRQIDVLRLYFNFPTTVSENEKVTTIVKQIQSRYRDHATDIRETASVRIKCIRLIKACKDFIAKRKLYPKSIPETGRQEAFHNKILNLFDVTQRLPARPHQVANNDSVPEQNQSNLTSGSDSPDDSDSPNDSDSPDESDDPDYVPSPQKKIPIPDELLEKINASKGSYRVCEKLLEVGVEIAGANPIEYTLSKTSIHCQITEFRTIQRKRLLTSLKESASRIILQFDCKSFARINARHVGNTERGDVPLSLFPIINHTGAVCADAIIQSLLQHRLEKRVVGLVCDTEKTNTGQYNGVCALIEWHLKTDLLHLLCRHHIFEVILKDVYTHLIEESSAARMTTFDVLIDNWDAIKNTGFASAPFEFRFDYPLLRRLTKKAIATIKNHDRSENIRDDYAELNDLVLKFLGVHTGRPFKVPGATNNARWMARAIYALKMYLFRHHLDLDENTTMALELFCIFVAVIYTKYWNRCSIAVDAPFNDIALLKELDLFRQIDTKTADVASAALMRHLWYIGDELISLSFFSDKVTNEKKLAMVQMLQPRISHRTANSLQHTTEIEDLQNIELHHFISSRSLFLFEHLQIDTSFLEVDPADWNELQSYRNGKKTVCDLVTVVNDSAERALQLGANIVNNQRVQSEDRLQEYVASNYPV